MTLTPEALALRKERLEAELAILNDLTAPVEDDTDEEMAALMREMLGEWRKQQIVQQLEEPIYGPEHFQLATLLTQSMVEALEAEGWIDPFAEKRPWRAADPVVSRETVGVGLQRAGLKRLAPPSESLIGELYARAMGQDADDGPWGIDADDEPRGIDELPEELRPPVSAGPPKIKKPKKPKKPKPAAEALRYADGSLVSTSVLASAPVEIPTVHTGTVGWTRDEGGRLIPPARQPVKAVYPAVRGKGRPPRALQLGGHTTADRWVRDPSSGRMVPPDQVGQ